MARPTLLVRPGPPDTPQFVDIDCSGMDLGKTIQLLVNEVVRGSVPVDLVGNAVLTYIVPPGPVRNALTDLHACHAIFTDEGEILCSCGDEDNNSMALMYQP